MTTAKPTAPYTTRPCFSPLVLSAISVAAGSCLLPQTRGWGNAKR